MKIGVWVLLSLCLGLSVTELVQVIGFVRHGVRYHMYDYGKTTPNYGEFTAIGMRQMQSMGKILRK